eukprot:CAMPEP_0184479594 /NCGR_PEP_ID=MMETSP0113_2-20130426/1261_1 /TAXON_ID=91329 /ORGANISM="Norrisiella sphaerica, Strain BC52" /LENGTH=149 /DNA_ID=CAMNT_0026857715 /DNA_START=589 /DNA_END=1038 /DNA_ORIENTATION=-
MKQRKELKLALEAGELNPPSRWPNGIVGTSSRLLKTLADCHIKKEMNLCQGCGNDYNGASSCPQDRRDPTVDKGIQKAKKLMEMQGWKQGKGLGKQEQGIHIPVQARGVFGRIGIGYEMTTEEEAEDKKLRNRASRVKKRMAKRRRQQL